MRKCEEDADRSMAISRSFDQQDESVVSFNNHAVGQVLGVVLEKLSGGSRTVGQLQFLQFLQLNEA